MSDQKYHMYGFRKLWATLIIYINIRFPVSMLLLDIWLATFDDLLLP